MRSFISKCRVLNLRMVSVTPLKLQGGMTAATRLPSGNRESRMGFDSEMSAPRRRAHAERWVRSVKEECLSKLILFGESSLRRALQQYVVHYHEERNHQGKENRILFPSQTEARRKEGAVRCRERLGGLLKYYEREAA